MTSLGLPGAAKQADALRMQQLEANMPGTADLVPPGILRRWNTARVVCRQRRVPDRCDRRRPGQRSPARPNPATGFAKPMAARAYERLVRRAAIKLIAAVRPAISTKELAATRATSRATFPASARTAANTRTRQRGWCWPAALLGRRRPRRLKPLGTCSIRSATRLRLRSGRTLQGGAVRPGGRRLWRASAHGPRGMDLVHGFGSVVVPDRSGSTLGFSLARKSVAD